MLLMQFKTESLNSSVSTLLTALFRLFGSLSSAAIDSVQNMQSYRMSNVESLERNFFPCSSFVLPVVALLLSAIIVGYLDMFTFSDKIDEFLRVRISQSFLEARRLCLC